MFDSIFEAQKSCTNSLLRRPNSRLIVPYGATQNARRLSQRQELCTLPLVLEQHHARIGAEAQLPASLGRLAVYHRLHQHTALEQETA
jgi:hypothetical protein